MKKPHNHAIHKAKSMLSTSDNSQHSPVLIVTDSGLMPGLTDDTMILFSNDGQRE